MDEDSLNSPLRRMIVEDPETDERPGSFSVLSSCACVKSLICKFYNLDTLKPLLKLYSEALIPIENQKLAELVREHHERYVKLYWGVNAGLMKFALTWIALISFMFPYDDPHYLRLKLVPLGVVLLISAIDYL